MGDFSALDENPYFRVKSLWSSTPAEYVMLAFLSFFFLNHKALKN
jgi:hypothetical protein